MPHAKAFHAVCCPSASRDDNAGRALGRVPTQHAFAKVFKEYGLPLRMRTDNGTPFASTNLGGLSKLSVWWVKLGILPERTRPAHPQDNGQHERMHRTLKAETTKPPRSSLQQQLRLIHGVRTSITNDPMKPWR